MEASNVKAMREALAAIINTINEWNTNGELEYWQYSALFDIADKALSAPPRNCDIGTSEEQAKRFYTFCEAYRAKSGIKGVCSSLCPCIRCSAMRHCLTKWSQMPYKEGGAK